MSCLCSSPIASSLPSCAAMPPTPCAHGPCQIPCLYLSPTCSLFCYMPCLCHACSSKFPHLQFSHYMIPVCPLSPTNTIALVPHLWESGRRGYNSRWRAWLKSMPISRPLSARTHTLTAGTNQNNEHGERGKRDVATDRSPSLPLPHRVKHARRVT